MKNQTFEQNMKQRKDLLQAYQKEMNEVKDKKTQEERHLLT